MLLINKFNKFRNKHIMHNFSEVVLNPKIVQSPQKGLGQAYINTIFQIAPGRMRLESKVRM